MRNTKSAFTLVELIVVITILAILGTIAFISLQGYSAEARDSKRLQDLSSISSSLNIKLTRGMSVLSAVSDDSNSGAVAVAGFTGGLTAAKYKAGKVNYTALEMKASEFKDPFGQDYRIGATTLAGAPFELAAKMEEDGTDTTNLVGNYNRRTTSSATSPITGSGTNYVTVALTETGKFKSGDQTNQGEVTKVSTDGTTIYFASSPTTGIGDITLSADESTSLLFDASGTVLADESTTALPY